MINAICQGLLALLNFILSIVLLPITALISQFMPIQPSQFLNPIYDLMAKINPLIGFFSNLMPPVFKSLFSLWLTFVVGYYTILVTYKLYRKVYTLIKNIKFW